MVPDSPREKMLEISHVGYTALNCLRTGRSASEPNCLKLVWDFFSGVKMFKEPVFLFLQINQLTAVRVVLPVMSVDLRQDEGSGVSGEVDGRERGVLQLFI